MAKKVCILSSVHTDRDIRIFQKQAKSLVQNGYSVSYIVKSEKDEKVDGVRIIGLKKPGNRLQRIFGTVYVLFKKAIRERADIYHLHDPELIFVGLFFRIIGKKVVYDVHEDIPATILNKYWIWKPLRKFISKSFDFLEKLSSRFFSAVITATPAITNRFTNSSINALTVQNFPKIEELTFVEDLEVSKIENIVVFTGGITEKRGIIEMVKAVGSVPENYQLKFSLAGSFSSRKLLNRVQGIKGWGSVHFYGWVDRPRMLKILAKAKAGLLLYHPAPNHINAQPNKMFEYMAAGLPVICSDFPLWKEIIDKNKCGLTVDPQNPSEIGQAIKYILDNPEKATEMGKNGREAVLSKYNWSNEEKKLINLYESFK